MRNNLVISLFTSIIAYSITTLINLLYANPLKEVLYNGLIALFLVAIITFLITYILDNYQPEKNSKKDTAGDKNNKKNNISSSGEKESQDESEAEDEFSPMDPTVLEVEEEESN